MSKKQTRAQRHYTQKADPNLQIVVAQQGVGTPAQMPRNMRAYIQEGYRGSKTVFRVVGHIARAAAGIKWKHYTDESKQKEITNPNDELMTLWKRPAPRIAGTAFREAMVAYYCMTGNSYVLGINANSNPAGKFDELYNLRPDATKVKVDDNGPLYYEFGNFTPPKRYADPFVMHNKLFAGNDDTYGLSPIEVAALLVDMQKAGQKWNLSLLSNMARPGGAWVTDALLGDTEYKGLKEEIRKKFAGPRNAGETAILHGGVKWQSMSMSPMELDWLESDTKSDRDIAGIFFNFPLFLLGLADSTYNNQAEARYALYTEICFPILDMFQDSLNMWLTPRYGGYLGYDQEDVEAIQERLQAAKAAASDRAAAEFTGGTTTFLEAREVQGRPSLSVKDFVMIGQTPVHIEDLDEYIEAQAEKVINPPPPPPMLPPTKIVDADADPNGDNNADDSNTGDNPPDAGNKRLFVRQPLKLLSPVVRSTKVLDLTTTKQKQAYAKSMEDRREKWYDQAQLRIADYFSSEQKTVMAALQRSDDTSGAEDRVQHALSTLEQAGTLKHILVSLYQDVGSDIGAQVMSELKSQGGHYARKDTISVAAQNYLNLYGPDVLIYLLQMAGQKVTQINGTTLAQIQSELSDGVAAGESIPDLAKRVDNLYLLQIIPNRSTVIARTETIAASNYGSQEAAKQSGLTLKHVWLSTHDSRTRPDHAAADGQEQDLDQPFQVGGSQLMYPGDSSLGAAADEIIQCRCTEFYRRVTAPALSDDSAEPAKRFDVSRERYRELLRAKR